MQSRKARTVPALPELVVELREADENRPVPRTDDTRMRGGALCQTKEPRGQNK